MDLIIQLPDELEYECIKFQCAQCGTETTEDITTEMMHTHHGHHLEMVTLEVRLLRTGVICVLQPVPLHWC